MPFLCVICEINKRGKSGKSKHFKICSSCYREIRGGYKSTKSKKIHTECIVCGTEINHSKSNPTCTKCRTKYYNYLVEQKILDEVEKTQDYSKILTWSIKKIERHNFTITITNNDILPKR